MQWLVHFIRKLPPPFSIFAERFDNSPIATIQHLEHFIQTRSSYIAQTAMYGYLKTRMGTSYRKIFEDQQFSKEIHAATVKLFGSCLCDLAIHCTAKVSQQPDQALPLALHLYDSGISKGLSDQSRILLETNLRHKLVQRLTTLNWHKAGLSMNAFSWSEADIVRHSPVIEEYKRLDSAIVRNSVHFRWVNIVEQVQRRLVPQALAANWQSKDFTRGA